MNRIREPMTDIVSTKSMNVKFVLMRFFILSFFILQCIEPLLISYSCRSVRLHIK